MSIDKRILYTDSDGNLCVVRPAQEWFDLGFTIKDLADKDVPKGLDYIIIEAERLPESRYFRNAWKCEEGDICIDMTKAIPIHLDALRAMRNDELKVLDNEAISALSKQDAEKALQVEEKKQALRDMPPQALVDMAEITTPEALQLYTPDILNKENE